MGKVLLVEDDNNLREIFEMRLQAEGYDTITASDGEEGLAVATKEKPALIIADVMMPKLSGFEMLETLRSSPEMANTKVVMMTALGQAEDRARGEKLGVVKYLVKSQVTLEDFVRVVRDVLPPDQAASAAQSDTAPEPANKDQSNNSKQESEKSMQEDNAPSNQPAPQPSDSSPAGGSPSGDMPSSSGQMSSDEEKKEVESQVNSFASGAPSTPPSPGGDASSTPPSSGFGGAPSDSSGGLGSSPSGMPPSDPVAPSAPAGDSSAPNSGAPAPGEVPKEDEHKDSSADTTL